MLLPLQAQARKAADKQAAQAAAAAQQQRQQQAAQGFDLQGLLRQAQRKWQDARRARPVVSAGCRPHCCSRPCLADLCCLLSSWAS